VTRFALICAGGAAGTATRYLVSLAAAALLGTSFAWGTLAVNVAGSFLISAIMHVGLATDLISTTTRLTLTTGFMGGLTTYSTFNYETLRYFEEGAWGLGAANMAATVGGCLAAGLLGFAAARAIWGS
jgi:fluoride exporter